MSSLTGTVALLKSIDLFSGLTNKELKLLAGCLRETHHADGHEIVKEGATDGRFYVVTDGIAVARKKGKKLGSFGPGQFFGEISLIDRGPRTATVTAQGPVNTLSAASFTFRPVLLENPVLMHKLLVKLCERVRVLDNRLVG